VRGSPQVSAWSTWLEKGSACRAKYRCADSPTIVAVMGLFRKSEKVELPPLSERSIKFVAGELYGCVWSSAGDWNRDQNPSHVEAIKSILRKQKLSDFTGTAYLIPDPKRGRIKVEMEGKVVDQLNPESQAKVADRVTSPVPVKCRIQIIGKGDFERGCVTLYHTR